MNYYLWSQEYLNDAEKLNKLIDSLKDKRQNSPPWECKEIDDRIIYYRQIRYDFIRIANKLMQRAT